MHSFPAKGWRVGGFGFADTQSPSQLSGSARVVPVQPGLARELVTAAAIQKTLFMSPEMCTEHNLIVSQNTILLLTFLEP